jgi:2',3'-cyclic-nucleotide 2'-phosphodiesterase (5'-nucleotidase family)
MPVPRFSIVGLTALVAAFVLLTGAVCATQRLGSNVSGTTDRVTLSIVGTTDLHGRAFPGDELGGLPQLGGYLRNLRAARAADGGAVLLLDAGDTFQGGIESNLSEGALIVDAYNTLGYDALAIGNHEFEYGSLDTASANDKPSDMRGALKAAAARARFPFLAANLIDKTTGRPVTWPNVRPSTIVDTAGLRVGILGVMTYDGLTKTLAANVQGLATAALAPTVEAEARQLRQGGADVVVVLAHAGGRCERFDNPTDLSSCDNDAEIFQLARQLPLGLVDAIVAGHSHAAVAHVVAGIPIVQAYSTGRAFTRLDLTVERGTGVISTRVFLPQALCVTIAPEGSCMAGGATPKHYEGAPVEPDSSVMAAMQPELERVHRWREEPLAITIETVLLRNRNGLESPLGNLFADALLAAVPGADAAIGMSARRGGLRDDLPAGALTRGALYDVFPFDNRVVTLTLTGAQLRQTLSLETTRGRRGIPSVSGVHVLVTCVNKKPEIQIVRPSGVPIDPVETLVVATTDFFAARTPFDSAGTSPKSSLASAPLVRDAAASWLTTRGGRLHATDLSDPPRWESLDGGTCLAND